MANDASQLTEVINVRFVLEWYIIVLESGRNNRRHWLISKRDII